MTERELYGFIKDQHRGVLVRPALVEIAGDFTAGALLSQITYWYAVSDGFPPGCVEREDRVWLVRRRTDWQPEIGLTPREVDRAIKILVGKDLIQTRVWKYGADPTVHISPNSDAIALAFGIVISKSPIGEKGITDPLKPWKSRNGEKEMPDPSKHPSSQNPGLDRESPKESSRAHKAPAKPEPEPQHIIDLSTVPQDRIESAKAAILDRLGIRVRDWKSGAACGLLAAELARMEAMG